MNIVELRDLSQQVKVALTKLNEQEDRKDMQEIGALILPAIFMLTEMVCDVKRIADSLETYNSLFFYGKENN